MRTILGLGSTFATASGVVGTQLIGGHGRADIASSCVSILGTSSTLVFFLTSATGSHWIPTIALGMRRDTVRSFQSISGLTLSSQGIPRIIWLLPRGATRTVP